MLSLRLFVRSRHGQEVEREAELLAYQISHEVVTGRHPVSSQREAIKMAAIMAQLEFGDWEKVGREEEGEEEGKEGGEERRLAVAKEALLKFGPMKLTQMMLEHDRRFVHWRDLLRCVYTLSHCLCGHSLYKQWLTEWWALSAGKTRAQCARDFLNLALQWELCGASLFLTEVSPP